MLPRIEIFDLTIKFTTYITAIKFFIKLSLKLVFILLLYFKKKNSAKQNIPK